MEQNCAKISHKQLLFSIACFIQGSTLLSAFVLSVTKQDTWLVVLTGTAMSLGTIAIYIALVKMYPQKTILEILEAVFGTLIGKLLSLFYLFYFLSLAALNTRDVGNFVVGYIMPETPIAALLIMFIFICAWAVREGIETLMSFAYWFVVITSVVIAFIFLLLVGEMDFRAFLPAFQLPLMKYVQGTHIVSAIPLCEIIVFLMVVPRLRLQEKVAKSFYMGFLIGTVTLLVIIIRDTAVLENMLSYVTLPSYEAVKLIDIGDIITRMEVLYAIELLFLQFFKVSILYWAFIFGFAQIFHLRTYKPYVLIAGILIISLSISIFDSSLENANWGHSTAPFYSSIFQLLIPGITLVGAFLRNMFRKMEVKRE